MAVGRWHDGRYDVVVVPAPEVLVLEKGAVVYLACCRKERQALRRTLCRHDHKKRGGYITFVLLGSQRMRRMFTEIQ